ncbi:Hpt domain-containing protein [Marinomonas balearica]|uniref:Hpt domain-containing protein n=1 Tax=Marinomonas balearica TaxID=491947 RepID=A0A4R6M833_9GAMM|nr:Hpt domain-containing protein [Marinomonas balearica]TDO97494.1 Hpt domain-containing protein [Marinomonas balearica]
MSKIDDNLLTEELVNVEHLSELKLVIGLDALDSIKKTYIADVQQKFPELLQQSERGNFHSIHQLSHSLKSASANMGLVPLSKLYAEIESAGEKEQHESILALIQPVQTLQNASLTELNNVFMAFEAHAFDASI